MEYPVLLTTEGNKTLATFPDCPGCQTFAEPGEDILALAQEALEGWLEVGLEDGEAPPRPSEKIRIPRGAKLKRVQVNPKLTIALSRKLKAAHATNPATTRAVMARGRSRETYQAKHAVGISNTSRAYRRRG